MKLSAELRWFWKDTLPEGLNAWFGAERVEPLRTDVYLRDSSQSELGLKRREHRFEVKGLIARLGEVDEGPFHGALQLWSKWELEHLRFEEQLSVTKLRRSLQLEACQLELTQLSVEDQAWWTLGFEASGELASVEQHLRAAIVSAVKRKPPALPGAICESYPAWLKRLSSAR